jgi:adenine C2-methylase RlmN of 23S rRNA A2503 and tRNA A37
MTKAYLDKILDQLNPTYHRLDLCDVNPNRAIEQQREMSNEKARMFLAHVKERGFEAKLFSSFGTDKNSGCGMLTSARARIQAAGTTTISRFAQAVDLLRTVLKEEI